MAWSDAARAAAAETRRRHAKTRGGGFVRYNSRDVGDLPSRGGSNAVFRIQGKGAPHMIFTRGKIAEGKKTALGMAKRIAARRKGSYITVTKLG